MFTRTFDIENDHMRVTGIPGHWDVFIECKDALHHDKLVWGYLDTSASIDELYAAKKVRSEWLDGERSTD